MNIFCKNCGTEIEEGALFCSACGQRAEIPVPAVDEAAAAERTAEPEQVGAALAEIYKPTVTVKEEKQKTFFGKGALALCLVVIALLSASTGMFAYLYFALVNRLV